MLLVEQISFQIQDGSRSAGGISQDDGRDADGWHHLADHLLLEIILGIHRGGYYFKYNLYLHSPVAHCRTLQREDDPS